MYFEPLWVFSRTNLKPQDIPDLRARRLAIGPEGSGVRPVAELLLDAAGLTPGQATLLPLTGLDAVRALQQDRVDAVFFVAAPESQMVQTMIHSRGVALMSFPRADAYTLFYPFLTKLVLPEGGLDLPGDVPPRAISLVAPAANLVVRRDFHPALTALLLMIAAKVHGDAGMFGRPVQFPSPEHLEYPLSAEARRYYQSGPPFLVRYLPFWAATLADRMKVLLLPLVTLLIPLFKLLPPVYRWRVRSKVYRWYRDVRGIDVALVDSPGGRSCRTSRRSWTGSRTRCAASRSPWRTRKPTTICACTSISSGAKSRPRRPHCGPEEVGRALLQTASSCSCRDLIA